MKITGYLLVILFIFTSIINKSVAQRRPGNEWIKYNQTYYKIKVAKDGIYRLGYSDLQNAGLNAASLDPTHLQLFFRGYEVPIYASSGTKTSLTTSDYIEFYGQHNDGAMDSVLYYVNPKDYINQSYSSYTDTAAYFLTVSPNVSSARYKISAKKYNNAPLTYFINEAGYYPREIFQNGVPIDPSLNFGGSDYNAGEGWMSKNITSSRNASITTPNSSSDTINTPKPQLEILIYGKSDVAGQDPDHHLQIFVMPANKLIYDTIYNGFATIHKTLNRNWSDIIKGGVRDSVFYKVVAAGIIPPGGGSPNDVIAISFLKFRYASSYTIDPNLPVLSFKYMNSSSGGQTDFNFVATKAPTVSRQLVLYDLNHMVRSDSFTMTGKTATLSIDNFTAPTNCYLYDTKQFNKAISISKINFTQPDYTKNYNFIIVSNKTFTTGANAYATYKQTQLIDSVNHFNPLIVYSDDLYDQFYYGVHHPAAIQNFMAFMYNNASQKPQYLLLLGKGINCGDIRTSKNFDYDYVPGIGYPPTDAMFTTGIDNGFSGKEKVLDPKMGIGRLQVLSNTEILGYLDKLKTYDANITNPDLTLKTAINIDGGDNNQITDIQTHMDSYAATLSGPQTGLHVNSYYSVSNSAVNKDLKASIQKNIESGTSLVSYLAHGAAEQLQVEFCDTPTLKNANKYPIMYFNGCNLGNAFLPPSESSIARFFTLAPGKGAIVWLSHSNTALDNVLYSQMGAFFKNVSVNNYGKSIGSTWRKTIADLKNQTVDPEYRALCQEWILQGDPSIRFPYPSKPDYALANNSLYIAPLGVTATSETFSVAVPVENLGRTDSKKIDLRIRQTFPDLSVKTYDTLITPVRFLDTIYFLINRGNINIQGVNKFDVFVNPDSTIKEINYKNNQASFSYYFQGNSIRTILPSNYEIMSIDTPMLTAQARNPLAYATGMYFEIDTTSLFNSPLKQKSGLLKGGSTIQWRPKLNFLDKTGKTADSTVYYWRSRMNLPSDTGGQWETKSFIYQKNSHTGWSQSHWQQYKKIQPDNIIIDTVGRRFSFDATYAKFDITANAWLSNDMSIKSQTGLFEVYGTNIGSCNIAIIEYDKLTLQPYVYNRLTGKRLMGKFGNVVDVCNYIAYDMSIPQGRDSFIREIAAIPNGNYVLLCSRGKAMPHLNLYDDATFKAYEAFGDTMMRHIALKHRDSISFVIAGQKGTPKGNLIAEQSKYDKDPNPNPGDTAHITISLQGFGIDSGRINSEIIGPAITWQNMSQIYRAIEKVNADQHFMQIRGIDSKGTITILYDSIKAAFFDLSKIDAKKYPYLQLSALLTDNLAKTPPQLRMWQVQYINGLPEGTILADAGCVSPGSRVSQGDPVHVKIKFQNISNLPMDSILIKMNIGNGNIVTDSVKKFYPPLKPGKYFWIDTTFSSKKLIGNSFINILANPGFQQPELTLDNNYIQYLFKVTNDITNPILDVTFDGTHITDGQVVSSTPVIKLNVLDESRQLILNDTSDFKLFIQSPGQPALKPVYFSNTLQVHLRKGDSVNNDAVVTYTPGPLVDGIYYFVAQATDRSGNYSGAIPYDIHFTVINKSELSHMYMYPNPFTDAARFVFTLTGSVLPDMMQIQITDLAGRPVRTIDLGSSGKLHIGVNEIFWDGTNDNGAKLRQGMYLYKMITQFKSSPDNYSLPEDAKLNKGFGKILIISEAN